MDNTAMQARRVPGTFSKPPVKPPTFLPYLPLERKDCQRDSRMSDVCACADGYSAEEAADGPTAHLPDDGRGTDGARHNVSHPWPTTSSGVRIPGWREPTVNQPVHG